MVNANLKNQYFNWMYNLVCNGEYHRNLSYRKLLKQLHDREFTYSIQMDSNRAEDGIDLRYRFAYEYKYSREVIEEYLDDRPCSVLEMLVALAVRCEEHIMYNSEMGDRTGKWFWNMLSNLGLRGMYDSKFNDKQVNRVIDRLLDRDYEENGEGGLFTVNNCRHDLRNVDIWYQMCWYLNSI